jgi:hypothetical protein
MCICQKHAALQLRLGKLLATTRLLSLQKENRNVTVSCEVANR